MGNQCRFLTSLQKMLTKRLVLALLIAAVVAAQDVQDHSEPNIAEANDVSTPISTKTPSTSSRLPNSVSHMASCPLAARKILRPPLIARPLRKLRSAAPRPSASLLQAPKRNVASSSASQALARTCVANGA